jgi:PAS domain S-box-containing protein
MQMTPSIDKELILKQLVDGVFVCTKEGNLVYSNPAFARTLGYDDDKIKTRNIEKHLIDRNLDWRALVSLLEQGSYISDYETKLRRADGILIVGSMSACELKDLEGRFLGIAGVLRDMTTRKGIEAELREKAFRIDVLNKIARAAAEEADVRRRALVDVCRELQKLINFDVLTVGITEEKGRHVDIITPAPDEQSATKTLGTVPFEGSLVEKLKFSGGAILVERDAARRPYTEYSVMDMSSVQSFLAVPLISRGRVLGSLNIGYSKPSEYHAETADILRMVADQVAGQVDNFILLNSLENRIKLQDALVRSGVELQKAISTEQIYAAIASNIRDIVPYTDLSFYIVDWQKRLVFPKYAIGNWTNEVMSNSGTVDEGIVGVVAKSGRAEFTDDVDADPRSVSVPGTPLEHNSMLALPLIGTEGVLGVLELYRPKGHVFTVSDLESGKLFAQQAAVALSNSYLVSKLQEANKEIELLNDLMFHDINNFNFATLNYIETIAGNPETPASNRAYLEKSLHLIRQTARLIEDVKKLTRIGAMNPQDFAPVDLNGVLRKIVSGLETSFPGRRVNVNLVLPESSHVVANSLLEELFVNLLSNSVKYDPHDEVEIDVICERHVESGKSFFNVSISDRGFGIPDDKKPKLFQKYVRLKPDSDVSGAGLGLSICWALADKFAGRIWVEDRVPGKSELGAKFFVLLPAAKEKSASR